MVYKTRSVEGGRDDIIVEGRAALANLPNVDRTPLEKC